MRKQYILMAVLAAWSLVLTGYLFYERRGAGSLEAQIQLLEVVDGKGQRVISISDAEHFPDVIIDGKTYKRAVSPGGMVFFNSDGNEVGGLALSKNESTSMNALVLDYSTVDALGMFVQENSKDKTHRAVFQINDKGEKIGEGNERILLQNENGTAGLYIKDKEGKTVIELSVDSLGNPRIQIPAEGKGE